jgi:hypothetical protein
MLTSTELQTLAGRYVRDRALRAVSAPAAQVRDTLARGSRTLAQAVDAVSTSAPSRGPQFPPWHAFADEEP